MKHTGKLEFRDIGPGQWLLHTDSGTKALFGDIDRALDGKNVEVTGEAAKGASAGMVTDNAVMVESVRAR